MKLHRCVPEGEVNAGSFSAGSLTDDAFSEYRLLNVENASQDIQIDPFGIRTPSRDSQGRMMRCTHSLGKRQETEEDRSRGHTITDAIRAADWIAFSGVISDVLPEGALMSIREASQLDDDDGSVMLFQKTLGLRPEHYKEYSASLPSTGIDDAQILQSYLYNVQITLAAARHPQAVDAAPLAQCILEKYDKLTAKKSDCLENSVSQ